MTESESVALPLGYTPSADIKLLGWMVGFEPTNTGATTQGLNHLTTPTIYLIITRNTLSSHRLDLGHIREYVPSLSLEISRLTSNSLRILNVNTRNTLSSLRLDLGHIHEYVPSLSLEISRLPSNSRRILIAICRAILRSYKWRPGTGSNRRPPA